MERYTNGSVIINNMVTAFDFVVLNVVLGAFLLGKSPLLPDYFEDHTRVVFVMANFSMLIAELLFPTIVHKRLIRLHEIFKRILLMTLSQTIIAFFMLRLVSQGGGFFRFFLVFFGVFFLFVLLTRCLELWLLGLYRRSGGNSRSVVFVGSDPSLLSVYHEMASTPTRGYKVLGYYGDRDIPRCPEALVRLGDLKQLNEAMRRVNDTPIDLKTGVKELPDSPPIHSAQEIFVSLSHDSANEIFAIRRFCEKNVIRFFYVPRAFGTYSFHLKPEHFGDLVVFTNYLAPLDSLGNRFIKRLFDIVVGSMVCLCLLPFIPLIALIIKIQSPGPLFFRQERTGLNGQPFLCLKFRSMHVNRQADTTQATKDDPRKFPFGDFMRRTNLDEFPQFFNVLKGEMSVVGPRPHMLMHTEMYSNLISKYMVRHFSKPGITGWAQVTGFRGETRELWQMEERIRRDIWYNEHWTFWLDLRIILMTVKSIVKPDKHAY